MIFDLIYIPSPLQWTTSQVSNIIQLFAAIGTVGTLIYVVIQGKENSRNIVNLSNIAQSLKDQLQLEKHKIRKSVAPDFISSPPKIEKNGSLYFSLMNKGHIAFITNIEYLSDDFEFEKKHQFPKEISQWSILDFSYKPKNGKPISDCEYWKLNIYYKDRYENKYHLRADGIHSHGGITQLQEL